MTKFQKFRLRMTLFRIWFFKNLRTFMKVVLTVTAIWVFGKAFGRAITAGDLDFKENLGKTMGIIWDILLTAASVVTSGTIFKKGLQRLSLDDIKTRKVKIALIQAGMFFDSNGHLAKRVEETAGVDLNNDGRIGDVHIEDFSAPSENIIKGVVRSASELGKIMTMEITDEDTLSTAAERASVIEGKEIQQSLKNAAIKDFSNKTSTTIDKKIKADTGKEVKTQNFFSKMGNKIIAGTSISIDFIIWLFALVGEYSWKGIKYAGIYSWKGIKWVGFGLSWPFVKLFNVIKNSINKKKDKKESTVKIKKVKDEKEKRNKQKIKGTKKSKATKLSRKEREIYARIPKNPDGSLPELDLKNGTYTTYKLNLRGDKIPVTKKIDGGSK